jgi:hypothetical protein
MEGKHTVDTGLLSLPVLIENMQLIGDTAGVEYTTGLEDSSSKDRDTLAKRSVEKMLKEKDVNVDSMDTIKEPDVEEPVEEEEEPKGLMSRRVV